MPPTRHRLPWENTKLKSLEVRSGLYVAISSGQTLAALLPPGTDHRPARPGTHPVSESVPALATANLGLIGPFHSFAPQRS